jgi:CDP-glycerol glycerophosphotransferase (TagB/SpsB family)
VDPIDNIESIQILWFSFEDEFVSFTILTDKGEIIPIVVLHNKKEVNKLEKHHLSRPEKNTKLPFWSRVIGRISQLLFIKRRYAGCWLFADRDFRADDNAEHLYRWVMGHVPRQNIFFALAKDSPDWKRLKKEKFRLIDIRSIWYLFAYVNCSWIISSNITGYIRKPGWKKYYAHLLKFQFCFMQHGVTKDYQPTLNRPFVDMLLTAARPEYHSIAEAPEYDYVYSARETQLIGFPRHDELLRKANAVSSPKILLIMPTWRENIVCDLIPGTGRRKYNPEFRTSDFFKQWNAVLTDQRLQETAHKNGMRILFLPHPYLQQQLQDFDLSGIHVAGIQESIQDILADTALLLTDYSSIAMELALIKRVVLYFQFDRDRFFNGSHSYIKGYFDYENDGFGEVIRSTDELIDLSIEYIHNCCIVKENYKKRLESFFAFHDQDNCRRVYKTLLEFSEPMNKKQGICGTFDK